MHWDIELDFFVRIQQDQTGKEPGNVQTGALAVPFIHAVSTDGASVGH